MKPMSQVELLAMELKGRGANPQSSGAPASGQSNTKQALRTSKNQFEEKNWDPIKEAL